jgi:hypothetical protein
MTKINNDFRWLSNTVNPKHPTSKERFIASIDGYNNSRRANEDWALHLAWMARHVIGPPQPTAKYSAKKLAADGMVGIYARPQRARNN